MAESRSSWFRTRNRGAGSAVSSRFNPEEDLDEEKHALMSLINAQLADDGDTEVEIIQEAVASGVETSSDLVGSLSAAAVSVTGAAPRCLLCPGLLESRFYTQVRVPVVAYGPGDLEVSHGLMENVEIARLVDHANWPRRLFSHRDDRELPVVREEVCRRGQKAAAPVWARPLVRSAAADRDRVADEYCA
jgi:hypothetical protein